MPEHHLTGSFRVRVFSSALREAFKRWPKAKHRYELRRQALKLRFWPEIAPVGDSGELLDVDWCWIKALKDKKVGELRLDDEIGGFENIRVIFYVGDLRDGDSMPTIWLLAALPKKRQEWTAANITTFDARRKLVIERFYQ